MKVVATYSIKGGVGKTAAAVNLGYEASRHAVSTLIWDLDPQGAATYSFRIKAKVKGGARAVVRGKRRLDDVIRGTDFDDLDLVPADFSYRNLDLLLDEHKRPTKRLARLLEPLRDEYDLVILDCPPSISLASESVMDAADWLIVPVIPTPLSLRTLDQLDSFLASNSFDIGVLPFFSMVHRRRRVHADSMASLRAREPRLLNTGIPSSSTIERVAVTRSPVGEFAPRSSAALAFEDLWDEVSDTLFGDRRLLVGA